MTRTARSAFPTSVEELTPLARDYAAELGTTPSRNQLMKRFKVGATKAKALLAALAVIDVPAEPERPALRPIVFLKDEAQKYAAAFPPVAAPVEPDDDAEPAPLVFTDTRGSEFADLAKLVPPDPAVTSEPESADDTAPAAENAAPVRRPVTWPVLILCLPAFVAIWAGWVEMGRLTGFGRVTLLPGITDFQIDTAITLPIGVETYAAYALWVWLSGRVVGDARAFAKWSAIGSLALGALGQVAYHLMAAAGWTSAPWPITAAVACIPVAVLGMGAALAHLMHQNH
ncbi:ABC transporter permease [Actinoplanes sp. NPDC049118]|uniref:ABC transporter permease n=1 Tax=Actinoplanes sp. NPDC049118 TaxID=3155769 RepID=UPI0034037E35